MDGITKIASSFAATYSFPLLFSHSLIFAATAAASSGTLLAEAASPLSSSSYFRVLDEGGGGADDGGYYKQGPKKPSQTRFFTGWHQGKGKERGQRQHPIVGATEESAKNMKNFYGENKIGWKEANGRRIQSGADGGGTSGFQQKWQKKQSSKTTTKRPVNRWWMAADPNEVPLSTAAVRKVGQGRELFIGFPEYLNIRQQVQGCRRDVNFRFDNFFYRF